MEKSLLNPPFSDVPSPFRLPPGLSLTRPQSSGHTALHKAAERGHLPLAKWLVETCDVQRLRGECGSGFMWGSPKFRAVLQASWGIYIFVIFVNIKPIAPQNKAQPPKGRDRRDEKIRWHREREREREKKRRHVACSSCTWAITHRIHGIYANIWGILMVRQCFQYIAAPWILWVI